MTRKWILGTSVATAIMASLCCILPIAAAMTGLGVLGAAARFEPLRPYLLGTTGVLLLAAIFLAYRDYRKACAPGSLCAVKSMNRWNFIVLGAAAVLVAGLSAFPRYSGVVAEAVLGTSASASSTATAGALSKVTFTIPDMDCPACAKVLSASLRKLPGVADATLDIEGRKAVVSYDAATQNIAGIEKVISDAGFTRTETTEGSKR